jgi:hypothetical protein
MNSPSPNGANGRGSRGQFAPGNKGGPGNPYAAAIGKLRSALLKAVTPNEIEAVAKALIDKAKTGDVPAIRELLDRILGRPVEADLLERLEALERAVPQESQKGGV